MHTLNFVKKLRKHGLLRAGVLSRFRNISDGRWEIDHHDIDGILALFEASFVRLEGEDILDEARNFSQCYLNRTLVQGDYLEPASIRRAIEYVLDHPFHLSIPRFNIKHYLEITSGRSTTTGGNNGIVYELAKLDFNFVQSMHQRELHQVARWWGALGLGKELKLARQNYLEWFMWPLIAAPEPQYSAFRVEMAKPVAFLFLIDDIFDIYGTVDELILFTEAVERWEVESTKRLPRFMKMSFMALYNTTNDIADKVLKKHGWNPIEPLRETWAAMCRAFLAEKRWLTSGNLPESEVYMRNGMISSGVPMSLIHMFVMLGEGNKKETMNLLATLPDLISHSAMIFRLWNDMKNVKVHGKERGDDGCYADCYLKECCDISSSTTSVIENVEEHVVQRLNDAWKKLNAECLFASPYSSSLRTASLNIARMAGITYSYDDVQRPVALRDLACSLLMENIPL
ncbi:hypothetical protein H6P81_007198 [Aristolochia fimbriata]|uniref:Uncharacterized protein n=1 Tax=Aristolochia fimbriata TaxID=158543 RepID=A0AAV7F0K9_ARIFI|nr:hypothetical protein H6P81_007198 [Aristolochia fimbriata]